MAIIGDGADVRVGEATSSDLDLAACLFHALGDRSRLTILRHLLLGEHRVRDLVDHLGLAQSTVSKHLACLRDCGLVTSTALGRASVHRVAHPRSVEELLRAAERILALTGEAVVLCPTHHEDER